MTEVGDSQPPMPAQLPGVTNPSGRHELLAKSGRAAGQAPLGEGGVLATGISGTWSLRAQHLREAAGQVQASVQRCLETSQSPHTSRPAASTPKPLARSTDAEGQFLVSTVSKQQETLPGLTQPGTAKTLPPLPGVSVRSLPHCPRSRPSPALLATVAWGLTSSEAPDATQPRCPEAVTPGRSREGTCRPLSWPGTARASLAPGIKRGLGRWAMNGDTAWVTTRRGLLEGETASAMQPRHWPAPSLRRKAASTFRQPPPWLWLWDPAVQHCLGGTLPLSPGASETSPAVMLILKTALRFLATLGQFMGQFINIRSLHP